MGDKNSTKVTDKRAMILEFYFIKRDLFLKAGHFPMQGLGDFHSWWIMGFRRYRLEWCRRRDRGHLVRGHLAILD